MSTNNEQYEDEVLVDADYLLSHGFIEFNRETYNTDILELWPLDMPGLFWQKGERYFVEKQIDRQQFFVIIYDDESLTVYVQEDVGCGFIEIPFPWSELPVIYFEAVYYGIRGNKPVKQ